MTIGQRVRMAREKRCMSQRRLGAAAGMSETYVFQLEGGKDGRSELIKSPTLETLEKLAAALDVPVEWLAFGHGSPGWAPDSPRGAA